MNSHSAAVRLAEIQNTRPKLERLDNGFEIRLPYNCYIEAAPYRFGDDSRILIENMEVVDEDLRNHGIGTRLVQCLFSYCSTINTEYVDSFINSPTAMRNRGRIFDVAALHFIEKIEDGEVELPLSMEQANLSLERVSAIWEAATEDERDRIDPSILTRVYLRDIDTGDWELPAL